MNYTTKSVDGYQYAFMTYRGLPQVVLDFWHKQPCEERFVAGNVAMDRFKHGTEDVVRAFAAAVGAISSDFGAYHLDAVVPIVRSGDEVASITSPTGRLAAAVGARLGVPVDVGAFVQTPRTTLHGGRLRPYAERYQIVYDNLRTTPSAAGRRVLLVDDVVTSGATLRAYADRLAEVGGAVRGVVAVMRYAQEQELLNAPLYGGLAG